MMLTIRRADRKIKSDTMDIGNINKSPFIVFNILKKGDFLKWQIIKETVDAPAAPTDALPADAAEHQVRLSLPAAAETADAAELPVRPPAVTPGPPKGAAEHRGPVTAIVTADAAVDAVEDKLVKI